MQALYIIVFCLLSANVGFSVASAVDLNDTLLKILQSLEDIKKQLKSLESTFEKKIVPVSNGCSKSDITDAITADKFELTEKQITEITDNQKVIQIVHNVYAGSSINMDTILNFARGLTNRDKKFRVFTALHDEILASGTSDPFKLIALVEAMERELEKQQNARPDFKTKVQSEIDDVIKWVKDDAVDILTIAMIADKYQKNAEIESLATAIFNFRTEVSNEVMEGVVDCAFEVVAAKKILDNISSHKHIPQVITGLTAIFNKFNLTAGLNNDAILDLASHLQKLQQRIDYKAIDQVLKNKVDGIIERLPTCARVLYFSPSVCFWNKGRKEYMYAASLENIYNKDRRTIFTWYSGNIMNGSVWRVQKIDDYYFFKNIHYPNEYLYSVNGGLYSKDMRYVFTWIPGYNTDEQSRWIIQLEGDYCYLKSTYNNEYMFASSVKYNKLNSYVFTWKSPTIDRSEEYQWQFRNCDQGGKI